MEQSDRPDRERAVRTTREGTARQSSLARTGTGNLFGTGTSPFGLMRRISDDIDRLFSEGFGRVGYGPGAPYRGMMFDPSRGSSLADASWTPQVETFRREDTIVIRADLPGISKDNVNIEIDDDVLTISGERSDETRDETDEYFRTERTYGRFFRAIALPDGVNADDIEAEFKDGVLEITVPSPKARPSRGRQIKVR
jgi:HSP20 family protein